VIEILKLHNWLHKTYQPLLSNLLNTVTSRFTDSLHSCLFLNNNNYNNHNIIYYHNNNTNLSLRKDDEN